MSLRFLKDNLDLVWHVSLDSEKATCFVILATFTHPVAFAGLGSGVGEAASADYRLLVGPAARLIASAGLAAWGIWKTVFVVPENYCVITMIFNGLCLAHIVFNMLDANEILHEPVTVTASMVAESTREEAIESAWSQLDDAEESFLQALRDPGQNELTEAYNDLTYLVDVMEVLDDEDKRLRRSRHLVKLKEIIDDFSITDLDEWIKGAPLAGVSDDVMSLARRKTSECRGEGRLERIKCVCFWVVLVVLALLVVGGLIRKRH